MEIQIEDINYSSMESDLFIKMTKDQKIQALKLDGKKHNSCKLCGYSTNNTSNLTNHLLVHSGERAFSCAQCEHSFKTAGNLKKHMLTHSGEKPFACTQCNYLCKTSGNLKVHIRVFQNAQTSKDLRGRLAKYVVIHN